MAALLLLGFILFHLLIKKPERVGMPVMETRLEAVADAGHFTVRKLEGEAYYPDSPAWAYHFTYAYPSLEGENYTAALINDTFDLALGETKDIALPMFAGNAKDGEKWEVNHDFSVPCNTDRLLSILTRQIWARADGLASRTLEAQTFNVFGDTAGDVMTLRGVALIQAGADPKALDAVTAEALPDYPRIVAGSSDQMEEKLLPALYQQFLELQSSGVIRQDADRGDYEMEFSPARDFYALPDGRIAFFFPPALLSEPSFDVPTFAFTVEEIEGLL